MQFLNDFKLALEKKKLKNQISSSATEKVISEDQIKEKLGGNLPQNVRSMFLSFTGLKIDHPRSFEILEFTNVELLDDRFLFFARMDEAQKICFDISGLNSAGEWDIVNYEDQFVITFTLSSFLTNKVWAWIDRSRKVWAEEFYD